jgi:hypothetical protein
MSNATTKAQATAVGTVISIGGVTGATGTETFLPLGSITDAKVSGVKVATTDVTTFVAAVKRKLGTIADYGTVTVTTLRVSNDPGQAAVVAAGTTGQCYDFKIQLPVNTATQTTTGDLIAFSAIVTESGGFDLSLSKQPDFTCTLEIDGAWVFTEGA